MNRGFEFGVRWHDDDMLEVSISAWNGAFAGATDVYVAVGGFKEVAENLKGFPRSPADEREVVLGHLGRNGPAGASACDSTVLTQQATHMSNREWNLTVRSHT